MGASATVELPGFGGKLFLPPRWDRGGATMVFAARERYEPQLLHLRSFVGPGMTVVDGGANLGIYTVAAACLVGPTGRVLAFEPGAESYRTLMANVALNGFRHVHVFHAALAETPGSAPLYHHRGPNSFSLARPPDGAGLAERTTTVTLDRIIEEEEVDHVDFVKLDVEGAEELVIRGGEAMIRRFRPTFVFEVYRDAAARLGLDELGACKRLAAFGYEFFELGFDGVARPLGTASPRDVNLVAAHPDRGAVTASSRSVA